jgi:hypothetical protein
MMQRHARCFNPSPSRSRELFSAVREAIAAAIPVCGTTELGAVGKTIT